MLRKIHRWFSVPFFLFFIVVLITGVYLQFVELKHGLKPSRPVPTQTSLPSEEQVGLDLQQAVQLAKQTNNTFPAEKIEISYENQQAIVKLSTLNKIGPSITVDLATKKVTQIERPSRTLRTYFLLFHSGKFFGITGTIVLMLSGIALFIISVTGIWEYINMYNRRRKANKAQLFW